MDCGMILRFVRSSLGRRMKDAFLKESLYREQPFIIGVPAKEIQGRVEQRRTGTGAGNH